MIKLTDQGIIELESAAQNVDEPARAIAASAFLRCWAEELDAGIVSASENGTARLRAWRQCVFDLLQ